MIRAEGLTKEFPTRGGTVHAVRRLDISVAEGEVFGLLGPNGAGKSTSLRMLSTLLRPTSGTATVAGADLLRDPVEVRRRIGYVAQGGGTNPSFTPRQELVMQARVYGSPKAEAIRQAEAAMRTFELEALADRKAGALSGGQRRRLDLALGMIHRPALVFLDEPTTGLDPQSRANLWDWVRRLRDDGTTIFLTTHYLDEADALCDRLMIFDHGVVVAEGTSAELKKQIAGDVITLGVEGDQEAAAALLREQSFVRSVEAGGAGASGQIKLFVDAGELAMPHVLRLLDSHSIVLQRIALDRPSLDDVFLNQTGRSLREDV